MFLGLRKLGNICCGHKMFLNKIRNVFCVTDKKFVSATNVARGNICVGNNVSPTMCPRLPGPYVSIERGNDQLITVHAPTSYHTDHCLKNSCKFPSNTSFLIQKKKNTQSSTITDLTLWIHRTEDEPKMQLSAIASKKVRAP